MMRSTENKATNPTCAESGGGYRQINALDEKSSLHFYRVGVLKQYR
jgi:hypothetical protein